MIETVVIRPPTTDDRPAILNVLRDAFRRDDEATLVDALWRDDAMPVELIAEEAGRVIGYCGFSPVKAEPALEGRLLGLAPLAVTNERQGQGVGKTLAMHGLERCRERDAALIVVLGEPEYYSRFGFKPASDHNIKWAAMDAGRAFQLIDFGGVTGSTAHTINYHTAFSQV